MRHRLIIEFETDQSAAFEMIQKAWSEGIKGIGGTVTNVVVATSESGMTFLDALAMNRPMRRRAWVMRGPIAEKDQGVMQKVIANAWAFPRMIVGKEGETCWINILSGSPLTLMRTDYESNDWECMP